MPGSWPMREMKSPDDLDEEEEKRPLSLDPDSSPLVKLCAVIRAAFISSTSDWVKWSLASPSTECRKSTAPNVPVTKG
ncbi:hypothetical protein HYQ46_008537 [Verticillium longisporum]|nr:hypothetical protein HYQ46_008537 [Verticillium longisporum]